MKIGDIQIEALIDGEAAVPPDSMYTNVDAEGFEPHAHYLDPCTGDLINTIGSYLIRHGDRLVLLDAGLGPKPTFPFVGGGLRSSLFRANVSPLDITDVIFSHLHVDHIGWASVNGKPYFPNATYRLDKRDWDHFCDPNYDMPEWETQAQDLALDPPAIRLDPVKDRIEFFEGDQEIMPGIEAVEASGHTPGATVLRLTSQGEQGLLIGDLVHSQPEITEDGWDFWAHVNGPKGIESIERIRKEIVDKDLPFAAAHFPGMHWGRLSTDGNGKLTYHELPN